VSARPACMSEAEYVSWQAANERILNPESRADSPCRDCTGTFHRDMLAAGTCDGTPGPRPIRHPVKPDRPIGPAKMDEAGRRTYWRLHRAKSRERRRVAGWGGRTFGKSAATAEGAVA
jgi:hypothetical protein